MGKTPVKENKKKKITEPKKIAKNLQKKLKKKTSKKKTVKNKTAIPKKTKEIKTINPIPKEEKPLERVNKVSTKKTNPQPIKTKSKPLTSIKGKNSIFQAGEKKQSKPLKATPKKITEDAKKYLWYVRDRLQENLIYPLVAKKLEIEGTVVVRFIIDKNGNLVPNSIKVVESSGSKILDRQAINTVKASAPFKPPPQGKITIEIPVVFQIIRGSL